MTREDTSYVDPEIVRQEVAEERRGRRCFGQEVLLQTRGGPERSLGRGHALECVTIGLVVSIMRGQPAHARTHRVEGRGSADGRPRIVESLHAIGSGHEYKEIDDFSVLLKFVNGMHATLATAADAARRSLTAALETMGIEVPEKM